MKFLKKNYGFIVLIVAVLISVGLISSFSINGNDTKKENNELKRIIYTCDDEYELLDDRCIKEIEKIPAKIEYKCESDYKLQNKKCTKSDYKDAEAKWLCPSGYTMRKEKYPDLCYKITTKPMEKMIYYCSNGYILNGTKCEKQEIVKKITTNVCPSASTYDAATNRCNLVGVFTSCPSGTSVGNRNGKYVTCYTRPSVTYECPSGTTSSGGNCISKKEVVEAKYVRGCAKDYTVTSDGENCTKTDYEAPSYKLSCDSGYKLNKDNCVKTITKDANKEYLCNDGYDLVDEKCIKYDVKDANITYKTVNFTN